MKDESINIGGPAISPTNAASPPAAVDRATFQAELHRPRVREKAHAQWSRLEAGRSDDLAVRP